MPAQQLSRRMSAEDAWFLYFERPDAPLHIGSVGVYEGDLSYDALFASMDARMHLIPRYRQRAIIPPFYAGHPTWEDDPRFSLSRHLHQMTLPAPGTEQQLVDAASEVFREILPRDRPLWDMTIVHGLEGARSAVVSRVHHCLVDGVSGIELLLAVLDMVPNPEPTAPPEQEWHPKLPPDPIEAWGDAVFESWSNGVRAFTDWQQQVLDPREQMRRMTDLAHSLEVALPAALRQPTKLMWNRPIGKERSVAWTEMSFQEVRGIRSALGGSVNDVMLTILGGALGSYLQSHGVKTVGLSARVMIPVNVRGENEKGALGNRVSMMLPDIPLGIADPVERLQAVRGEMDRLKAQSQAGAFDALRALSENLPAAMHAIAGMGGVPAGGANLVCTNVPGPMIPLYCVGHRMLAHYPLVPLAADLGIGAGITSFNTSLFLSIMCDPKIVPDIDAMVSHAEHEFMALRLAASVPETNLPDIGRAAPNGHTAGGTKRASSHSRRASKSPVHAT